MPMRAKTSRKALLPSQVATTHPRTRRRAHMPPNRAAVFRPLWCLCMTAPTTVGGWFVPSREQAEEEPREDAEQHEDAGAEHEHRGRATVRPGLAHSALRVGQFGVHR